jgi:hypothetical protein
MALSFPRYLFVFTSTTTVNFFFFHIVHAKLQLPGAMVEAELCCSYQIRSKGVA